MLGYIRFADSVSAWFGKAFAWLIILMAFGMGYEVFVRYLLNSPTSWSLDVSFIMYGTLFMMGGAYTLSRGGHVRGDFLYRLWKPRTQATVDLVLYIIFFFPGVRTGLLGLEIRIAVLAVWRGERQQPGRSSDLPVQDRHRRRRHPARSSRVSPRFSAASYASEPVSGSKPRKTSRKPKTFC
jgi:TRAP-type mannitol/chloroaromatic compound transport system permease small subunit